MALIDPSVFLAPTALVLGDVTIGPDASVWYGSVIRGDLEAITIGEGTNIQDLSVLHADPGQPCRIGRHVGVGHRAILHGCEVEDGCLIGMGSVVLNGAVIGAGSVVAAGALVPEGMRVPPGSLVMGVPGRVVRAVDPALAARTATTCRRYIELARRHRAGEWPPRSAG